MSELKAYRIKGTTLGDCHDVYLKSEADKVIALLKDKANYNETAYKLKSEELADTCRFYESELRHHKYRRCLAMAKWCRDALRLMRTYEVTEEYWNLEPGQDAEYYCKKGDFYSRWRKRWLELAEKFKEAK